MPTSSRSRATAVLASVLLAIPSRSAGVREPLPTLHARSRTIDVVDGGHLRRGYWIADPTVALDVYEARRSKELRAIEFRSDVDSLSLDVQPGGSVDFVIELEDGRRCPTRVSARRRGAELAAPGTRTTIPFVISDDRKIHVSGSVSGSPPLDLMFDTGADTLVLFRSGRDMVPGLRADGRIDNAGFSGVVSRETSSGHRLSLADIDWRDEQVMLVEEGVDRADGILGWTLFEDLVLEIDYERSELTVSDRLPDDLAGRQRLPIEYHGSIPCIAVGFEIAGRRATGTVVVDTGSSASLHVRREFALELGLLGAAHGLGTSRSGGLGGAPVTNDVVSLPALLFGDLRVTGVPVHVARSGGAPGSTAGTLGLDVLRRFTTILDARGDALYLAPNSFGGESFRRDWFPTAARNALIAGAVAAVLLLAFLLRRRSRRRAAGRSARE